MIGASYIVCEAVAPFFPLLLSYSHDLHGQLSCFFWWKIFSKEGVEERKRGIIPLAQVQSAALFAEPRETGSYWDMLPWQDLPIVASSSRSLSGFLYSCLSIYYDSLILPLSLSFLGDIQFRVYTYRIGIYYTSRIKVARLSTLASENK